MSALFFDIDGTILSEITHKIPESALEALHKAQENGHKTFINNGRTICSVQPMIKRIPFDGFLCGCGTHLIYGEQVVFHHSIPYERGREIIKSMKDCKVEGFLEGTEDIYYSNRISRLEPVESSRRYMAGLGLGREQAIEETGYDFFFLLNNIEKKTKIWGNYIEGKLGVQIKCFAITNRLYDYNESDVVRKIKYTTLNNQTIQKMVKIFDGVYMISLDEEKDRLFDALIAELSEEENEL